MKTFKFSLVLRTRGNTDVFITLDDNIYGIHSKRVNILYISKDTHERQRGFCKKLLGTDYFSATFYQTYFYYKPSKYSPFTETHFCNLLTQSRKADK